MKDNGNNRSITNGGGNTGLPLYDFFIALKQNNFSVSPKQITECNSIINEFAHQVKNEQELCAYLSAVIANTQEEQVQFKEIFDSFFKENLATPPAPPTTWEKITGHIKLHWPKYLLAVASVVLLWFAVWLANRTPPRPVISISAYQDDTVTNGKAGVIFSSSDTTGKFSFATKYNWGDGTVSDSLSHHFYKEDGTYRIKAMSIIFYKGKMFDTAIAFDSVPICVQRPQLKIIQISPGGTIKVGDTINLFANLSAGGEKDIHWESGDDTTNKQGEGKSFSVAFNTPGEHTISCTFSPAGSFCNAQDQLAVNVIDTVKKPSIQFAASPGAGDIRPSYKINKVWFYITATLALIGLFLTGFFALRWKRAKDKPVHTNRTSKEEYNRIIQSFAGKTGSHQLAFTNKNYLPLPEKEINDVARLMRMRLNDESPYLNIPRTIATAIDNAGFFQPVYSTRTQQCEYLVLIDEVNSNSQQVKLFEYLLDLLAKQNVFIAKFYYRRSPMECYSAEMPRGISLEKLSEKFPRHVLLIMGNAYQLLYPSYPVIDNTCLQLLKRWQYKAILTPVSFIDWGNKEKKALYEELPVVPVDIPGQILLMQKLFLEELNIIAELHQHSRDFYEAETVDFESIDELYEYCENAGWANDNGGGSYGNILFQWIAALATWPRVNWEMTLAIGKAILDKHAKTNELNFTNLLRIARIKWMQEGRFPDYTRTELLKKLEKENEVTARETILVMLNEIPNEELHSDHFAYEEKETQRLVNEFILYAYDPGKYKAYKNSKEVFGEMNANGQVTDAAALKYLENDKLEWGTLINTPRDDQEVNASLNDYFSSESGLWKKIYLWSTTASAVVFLLSLIGFLALVIVSIGGINNPSFFATNDFAEKDIKFDIRLGTISNKTIASDTTFMIAGSSIKINTPGIYTVPVLLDTVKKDISISIDGEVVFDTLLTIDKDGYFISSPKIVMDEGVINEEQPQLPGYRDTSGAPISDSPAKGIDTPVIKRPSVYIQVSDNSLLSSANQFRNALIARGSMDVNPVSLQQYNYNSEISYYDPGMKAAANEIKSYYNRYYPNMNVQARQRQIADLQKNKNVIAVWIRKLEPVQGTSTAVVYTIQHAKVEPSVREGEDISIVFEIFRADNSTGNINASIRQQQAGTTNTNGRICISSSNNCVNFEMNASKTINTVMQKLTTKGLKPGKYQVTVVADQLKISKSIGSFTITGNTANTAAGCDTVKTNVDRVSRNYTILDLEKKNIFVKVNEISSVFGSFTIQKDKCPEQKIVIYNNQKREVTLCDKSVFYFTLNGKNLEAIICNNAAGAKD